MAYKRKIENVKTNNEKNLLYREQMKKYKKAMSEEFYFEALLIIYAVIEDRYRAFLFHSAVLKTRESIKLDCNGTKEQIRAIVNEYSDRKNKEKKLIIALNNISGKAMVIKSLLKWANTIESSKIDDKYLETLKYQYESVDIGGLIETINKVSEWCLYRNEIIHGLMNKRLEDLNEHIADKVEEGKEMARFIDSQVAILKKGNRVRKSVGLN